MQSKIKRRPFGQTGLEVSEISFGAMNVRRLPDEQSVVRLINDVLDRGINLIDTARGYESTDDDGNIIISSEIMLGKVIASRKDIDEPLVIVTKGHSYTPDDFDRSLAESVERLQIRREDGKMYIGSTQIILVYLLHGIKEDRWTSVMATGVLDHGKKRQAEGKFHYFGFSSHYGEIQYIKEAIESGCFQACELTYNVYNPILGEEGADDLIKLAYEHGMGVINMKAFNGNGTVAIFKQLSKITGVSHEDMARFSLSNPYISTIDAGVRSINEFLADEAAAAKPPMSPEERSALRQRAKAISPYLNKICRECMHCVEKFACPQGIDFPRILGLHGRYSVSKSLGLDLSPFIAEYTRFKPDASACAACGACNEWCEYRLVIPDMMTAAAADLSGKI